MGFQYSGSVCMGFPNKQLSKPMTYEQLAQSIALLSPEEKQDVARIDLRPLKQGAFSEDSTSLNIAGIESTRRIQGDNQSLTVALVINFSVL